ncbi:MAG: hypothetical protein V4555_15770 [Acidobacteriota bacterium]
MNGWDWNSIYLTCFGIGLGLSFVSFFAGGLHMHGGHVHLRGHLGKGAHASLLNPFSMMAFLCWFGGAGYLMSRANAFGASVVLVLSLASGAAGAALVFWFLVGVLMPAEKTLETDDTELTGVTGRLSAAIPKGGVGELMYSQNGARRSAIVRSEDGEAMARDTEVVVMRHSKGVASVRRWDEFEHGLMLDGPEQKAEDLRR